MKIYGSRGAGKSTWIVNYLNTFHDCWNIILIVTPTLQQLLWTKLLATNITFIQPDIIKDIKEYFSDKTLLILDDCMVHLISNKVSSNIISEIYTNGRHMNVSIISLEQSINSTKLTMRQNSDYFLLFKIIDNKLLKDFGIRFASVPNFKYFFEACQYCWKQDQPILISTKYIHTLRLGFNKAILWKDNNKIKIIEIIKQNEVNIELSNVDIQVNDILSKYELPEYTYIDYRIDPVTVKMMESEEELSYDQMKSFFKQSFITGSKSLNLFRNIKRKNHLVKHRYEKYKGTDKRTIYYKLVREEKKNKIYSLYEIYTRQFVERRIQSHKDKDREKHKLLEIERHKYHLGSEYMKRWYPEFYS